ncbi:DUF3769 domain-containing protein [Thermosynechococcaceae cyanobacterium BACA0444]|uniref:DUF3769 domain-containing protein n=1 Tax=Pseudocalidococcus azoricus BACA0444 TaxID=2918990 RepID=A0AAE4FRA2_9CYAN|nr:DUF3769 domain-containing protein [Pseudocalidococcus azoricus]MDS3860303.1 DUF3769 domain-containing protein [Pseudocalidococcus azoricus BACA0444]
MPVLPPLFLSLPPQPLPPPTTLPKPAELSDLSGESEAALLGPGVNLAKTNAPNTPSPTQVRFVVAPPIPWQKPTRVDLAQVEITVPTPGNLEAPPLQANQSSTEPLETLADRQEYDTLRQFFNAIGDVFIRFREAELTADRVQTDLNENILVAEGNVVLTRGDQVIRGDRLEYNLILDRGVVTQASGAINIQKTDQFTSPRVATPNLPGLPTLPSFQSANNPVNPEGQSNIDRLLFIADRLEFDGRRWYASNLRLTNDPFTPPELEFRAREATLEPISPKNSRLIARQGRLVFDQSLAIPIPREEYILGEQQEILPFQAGYDSTDRGGFYLSKAFSLVRNSSTSLILSPEFYLQRAINSNFDLGQTDIYGATLQVRHGFTPTTRLLGYGLITNLDPSAWPNTARGNLLLQQSFASGYVLNTQGIFRERLINGSLGEQDLQSSLGGVFISPNITLGQTGINLNYQAGGQYITANSDQPSLGTQPGLGRLQGVVNLYREFRLWQGQTLPPTREEGLRYSPAPLQPYFSIYFTGQAVGTYYTSGNTQPALQGGGGFRGQLGHLRRNWFDYTGFDVGYSQTFSSGGSPFLFDRIADFSVLNVGARQQLYGPVLVGVTSQLNVGTGNFFNTNFFLEYSRRTYGLFIRYNVDLGVAGIAFRINGFNWQGNTNPFSSPNIGVVQDGVIRPDR